MHAGLILQRADDAEQVFGGGVAVRSEHAHQAPWRTSKPFFGPEETGLKPGSAIDHSLENGGAEMIEVAVILGLFCAGIFLAHAVDAYRAH